MQGGVGRACDATQCYTLTPWPSPDSLIPRSTRPLALHPAATPAHIYPPPPSLFLCYPPRSTFSRRCSSPFKQPMQYSAALGSRLWGWVGHRYQKKSPTWPEPPTVKLAPLSINRCDRVSFAPLTPVPLPAVFHLHPIVRSLPRAAAPLSLSYPSFVFLLFLFLFLSTPTGCIVVHRTWKR